MNRRDLPSLLGDLDDLALRCKDAGVTPACLELLGRARDNLWLHAQLPDRDSVPPVLQVNLEARATANRLVVRKATGSDLDSVLEEIAQVLAPQSDHQKELASYLKR